MGRKFQEIEIDGEFYTFTMLRTRVSTALLVRLFKTIAHPVGRAFQGEVKLKEIIDAKINLGNAITELANRITYQELQEIIDILFKQVMHKGEGELSNEATYDNCFAGKQKHLLKVATAALGVQYADFLEGEDVLAAIIKRSKKVMEQEMADAMTQEK